MSKEGPSSSASTTEDSPEMYRYTQAVLIRKGSSRTPTDSEDSFFLSPARLRAYRAEHSGSRFSLDGDVPPALGQYRTLAEAPGTTRPRKRLDSSFDEDLLRKEQKKPKHGPTPSPPTPTTRKPATPSREQAGCSTGIASQTPTKKGKSPSHAPPPEAASSSQYPKIHKVYVNKLDYDLLKWTQAIEYRKQEAERKRQRKEERRRKKSPAPTTLSAKTAQPESPSPAYHPELWGSTLLRPEPASTRTEPPRPAEPEDGSVESAASIPPPSSSVSLTSSEHTGRRETAHGLDSTSYAALGSEPMDDAPLPAPPSPTPTAGPSYATALRSPPPVRATTPTSQRATQPSTSAAPTAATATTRPAGRGSYPPIVVDELPDWPRHLAELRRRLGHIPNARPLDKGIRFRPKSADEFRAVQAYLFEVQATTPELSWHCYALTNERPQKIALWGLPMDTEPDLIVGALRDIGFPAKFARQLPTKPNARKCVYHIQLEPMGKDQLERLYATTVLLNMPRVVIEAWRGRTTIPQCHRCQQFGHSSANCHRPQKCVKCAGPHFGSQCPKAEGAPPTCANCGGKHAANSRQCAIFRREARRRKIRIPGSQHPPPPQETQHQPPTEARSGPTEHQQGWGWPVRPHPAYIQRPPTPPTQPRPPAIAPVESAAPTRKKRSKRRRRGSAPTAASTPLPEFPEPPHFIPFPVEVRHGTRNEPERPTATIAARAPGPQAPADPPATLPPRPAPRSTPRVRFAPPEFHGRNNLPDEDEKGGRGDHRPPTAQTRARTQKGSTQQPLNEATYRTNQPFPCTPAGQPAIHPLDSAISAIMGALRVFLAAIAAGGDLPAAASRGLALLQPAYGLEAAARQEEASERH